MMRLSVASAAVSVPRPRSSQLTYACVDPMLSASCPRPFFHLTQLRRQLG
jgi:hypothetical protein